MWFDSGGVVTNVFFLLLGSIFSFAVSQLMPAKAIIKRYVLALAADSQHTLNDLWAPPDMDVGENYAKLFKAATLNLTLTPTPTLPLPLTLTLSPTLTLPLRRSPSPSSTRRSSRRSTCSPQPTCSPPSMPRSLESPTGSRAPHI